jgi:quercetin dioxygenase-like cupin family protein
MSAADGVATVHPRKVSVAGTPTDVTVGPDGGWFDMDVRWLVTRSTVGAEGVVFGVTFFPPGSKHDIHRHPHAEEVEYLVHGSGVSYVRGDAVAVGQGEVVFVARNEYHGFENTSGQMAVMAWCYAGAASLEKAGYIRCEDRADPADSPESQEEGQ